jgi:intracellular septation protein
MIRGLTEPPLTWTRNFMQLLIEFLPILSFFIAYKFSDVFVATAVMLVVLLAVVAWQWFKHRKVGPMLLVSAGIGLIFGGLTLWLHDQTFVQWKPTVVYWLLALMLVGGRFFSDKPIIQRLLDATLPLSADAWRTLNSIWAIGFTIIGAINLYVVYHFSLNAWVNFKAYGLTALTLVFALLQGFWLANKLPQDADQSPEKPSENSK